MVANIGLETHSQDPTRCVNYIYLKEKKLLNVLFVILFVLSLGLLYLPYRWLVQVRRLLYVKADHGSATHVWVKKAKFNAEIVPIIHKKALESTINVEKPNEIVEFKIFSYLHEDFYYDESKCLFTPLIFNTSLKFETFHSMKSGIILNDILFARQLIFGKSVIDVSVPSIISTIIDEIFQPFFVFQVFCLILWCVQMYYWYSIAIFFIMVVTVVINVINIQNNLQQIRSLATYICQVEVLRNGLPQQISSADLVPGDVLMPSRNLTFPCDLVLLDGFCLVDETMLTGESQPSMKSRIPEVNNVYNKERLYTLSAGTKVVECSENCLGVVIHIGYCTAKGDLVRWILHPRPNRFRFVRECFIFLGILTIIALIATCIDIKALMDGGLDGLGFVFVYLTIISTAIPPILPLTFSVGIGYSFGRLKKKKISCIDQEAINASGRVSVICFDKTGTLTTDQMTLVTTFDYNGMSPRSRPTELPLIFQTCLATCHSLAYINKQFYGDPMEIAIVKALGWHPVLTQDGKAAFEQPLTLQVFKSHFIYHFSPEVKRMAVVVESNSKLFLFVKGAPEVIIPLCDSVNADVYSSLNYYTQSGLRVLACAYKVLDSFDERMKLEEVELGLEFLGFPVLENLLRDDALSTISTLRSKRIHCLISTGDNVYTGLAVGKTVGIVDEKKCFTGDFIYDEVVWNDLGGDRISCLPDWNEEFEVAISGGLLEHLYDNESDFLEKLLNKCKVFGRMTPKHKILLIELFQTNDTMVAMVGDGANDCGALKQADVGLSLSDAEASIAAPFSAMDLGSIIEILKEGRCSLVTCFQSFKFIVAYSMLELHVIIMMHYEKTALTNNQYIWYDAINVFPLTFTMAASLPYHRLSKRLPPGSVMSAPILFSVFGMMIINTLITLSGLLILRSFSWYDVDKVYEYPSYVNWGAPTIQGNVIFCQGGSQLIILAAVFSIGRPYRQAIYKNIPFMVSFLILIAFDIYFIFDRSELTFKFVEMYGDSYMSYRWAVFGIFIGGSLVIYSYEVSAVPFLVRLVRKK